MNCWIIGTFLQCLDGSSAYITNYNSNPPAIVRPSIDHLPADAQRRIMDTYQGTLDCNKYVNSKDDSYLRCYRDVMNRK